MGAGDWKKKHKNDKRSKLVCLRELFLATCDAGTPGVWGLEPGALGLGRWNVGLAWTGDTRRCGRCLLIINARIEGRKGTKRNGRLQVADGIGKSIAAKEGARRQTSDLGDRKERHEPASNLRWSARRRDRCAPGSESRILRIIATLREGVCGCGELRVLGWGGESRE